METKAKVKCFGGWLHRCKHKSAVLGDLMADFSVYLPEIAEQKKVPQIYWLSGLTCSDENFVSKAGAFRKANELGVALIIPDTSPRGAGIPGEDDSYDFGSAAGFYLNATKEPWSKNYKMYDYLVSELPGVVNSNFAVDPEKVSIMGHSMGGHGALTIALKNPAKYKSCSAFAPIVNPIEVPWGKKAFSGYLGDDQEQWKMYDACELMKTYKGPDLHILIDQGTADSFLADQLKPENLDKVCKARAMPISIRLQEGYDHSYYFISSFIDEHIAHHARFLQ
uniref:S-formylglutathione hydrolase n=1 Tax=Chromera velia CCMP2878 TaxID=1169474 RepID=A0A0G4H970_9ALVE|eukprot:Cvel_25354.t1-p1 / transcript=Cvel_25354.t1 / gene=Cvel_25354 / organism=Chromera_velia_CCMP2878 / gene_product=S-formylglutathione hydrolase, putative / transcript_product=S-formylglutathione hydrolase, putative / location=Cvel_scaffold2860:13258-17301(-) / protein_length=279 / sequence_SO=supercontig / SO=protein_coding / is_pseudo=false